MKPMRLLVPILLVVLLAACTTLPGSVKVSGEYRFQAIAAETK